MQLFALRNTFLKASILAVNIITLLLWAMLALCAFPTYALAYVDPSVMTYAIQAVAGVAVALSAVLGVFARRTRKKLFALLDIDEQSKREMDPPVYRLDEQGQPIIPVAIVSEEPLEEPAEAVAKKKRRMPAWLRSFLDKIPVDRRPFAPRWRTRFAFALLACGFTIGSIFIIAPLEIAGGSAGSLIYGLGDIWWIPTLPGLAMILGCALVVSAFRKRLYLLILTVVASIGLAAYIQSLFLNIGVPIANGDTIVWGEHAFMMTVCAVVWTAVIAACVLLYPVNARRTQGIVGLVSGCLLAVQLIGLGSLVLSPPDAERTEADALLSSVLSHAETVATEEGLYTLSSKDNVVVFVLDTFDTSTMKGILNDTELLAPFTGFTCFTNVTGSMIPTHYAVPALLTGQLPRPGELMVTYDSQRYARGTFLPDLEAAGYSIGLYSDSLGIGEIGPLSEQKAQVADRTVNIHGISASTIDFKGSLLALWQIALYREMPWGMKPLFWYYTDQINQAMVHYDANDAPEDTVYITDDVRWFNQLQNLGLTIDADDSSYNGAFRFIHLLGAHYPYNYDEKGVYLGTDKSTINKQARGSLYMVGQYLERMKQLGVYDDATIIVTGDHGTWWLTNDELTSASCPILLVKPAAKSGGDPAKPLVSSVAPVSHSDILGTIRASAGLGDGAGPEDDTTVFDFTANDINTRTRYYYTTNTVTRKEVAIVEYAITGDAGSIKNWKLTGVTWDPQVKE